MDDPALCAADRPIVRVVEGFEDLGHDVDDERYRQLIAAGLERPHELAQVLAVDQVHGDEEPAVDEARVVHREPGAS
jgi:hypothetical protein